MLPCSHFPRRLILGVCTSHETLSLVFAILPLDFGYQASVVQKADNAIHRVNVYPLDTAIGFPNTYPLDSIRWRYQSFEQPGLDDKLILVFDILLLSVWIPDETLLLVFDKSILDFWTSDKNPLLEFSMLLLANRCFDTDRMEHSSCFKNDLEQHLSTFKTVRHPP